MNETMVLCIAFAVVVAYGVAIRMMQMSKQIKRKLVWAIVQMALGTLLATACLPYVSEIGFVWWIVFTVILVGVPAIAVYKTAKALRNVN